jgi:hypothetical protein
MKRIMCSRYAAVPLVLWLVFVPLRTAAEQFTGKVVGISDGDTLSVLCEGKAVQVPLAQDMLRLALNDAHLPPPVRPYARMVSEALALDEAR